MKEKKALLKFFGTNYTKSVKKDTILVSEISESHVSFMFMNHFIESIDYEKFSRKICNKDIVSANMHLKNKQINLFRGGPLDMENGTLFHSTEYICSNTNKINNHIACTTDMQVINDILNNKGPSAFVIVLGYGIMPISDFYLAVKNNIFLPISINIDMLTKNTSNDNDCIWFQAMSGSGYTKYNIPDISVHG